MEDEVPDCLKHYSQVAEEIGSGSDIRLCTMLGVGYLERYVALAIRRHFSSMTNTRADALFGAVRSFTARVDMAEATGVVASGVGSQWRLLAKIRNRFAHRFEVRDASDPQIVGWLKAMPLNRTISHFEPDERLRAELVSNMGALCAAVLQSETDSPQQLVKEFFEADRTAEETDESR